MSDKEVVAGSAPVVAEASPGSETSPAPAARKRLGIASLVVSAGAVAGSSLAYPVYVVAVPLGIAGVVLGIVSLARKERPRGFAIAGMIVSGAITLIALLALLAHALFASGASTVGLSGDALYNQIYGEIYPAPDYLGNGSTVVGMAGGVSAGVVTVSTHGAGSFVLQRGDADGNPISGPIITTEGDYDGVVEWGLEDFPLIQGGSIVITTDRDFTVNFQSVSAAAQLVSGSGNGDFVYRYDGPDAEFLFTHEGAGDFSVTGYGVVSAEVSIANPYIDVNGAYSGAISISGPSILVVRSDGDWTVSKQ